MKINNEKGWFHMPLIPALIGSGSTIFSGAFLVGCVFFSVIAALTFPHIAAWSKAKHDHTEQSYQMQTMWPQYKFAEWGHTNYQKSYEIKVVNSGNFVGGKTNVGQN